MKRGKKEKKETEYKKLIKIRNKKRNNKRRETVIIKRKYKSNKEKWYEYRNKCKQ